ncbi:MAG: HD domain-containing phosphohydrolase [candidate division WOR-3 bacterium]
MKEKILVADGEITVANFLKKIIEYEKKDIVDVDIATDGVQFKNLLSLNQYSLIIVDLSLPGTDVFDFITSFSIENPFSPIIVISATIDINLAMTCIRSGAYDFVSKPFTADTMLLVIRNAYEKRQLLLDKERLSADIQKMNEELLNTNQLVSEQKEKLDNYLKELLKSIEELKTFSEMISVIKSFESNSLNIFEKLDSIFNPHSLVLLLFDEKSGDFVVKKERNFEKEFPVGTKINKTQFIEYFKSSKINIGYSLKGIKDNSTVTLPIFLGKLIIGVFIFEIDSLKIKDEKIVLFEIARIVIMNSLASAKFFEDSRRSYLESLIAFLYLEDRIFPGLKKHSEKVSALSVKIAKRMELSDGEIRDIQYSALLHLLGLLSKPKEIFNAPTYFDPEKSLEIKQAIVSGADIIAPFVMLEDAQKIIKFLYENYDGTGFNKLVGKKIPVGSRIVRVAGEYCVFKDIFKLTDKHIEGIFNENVGKLYDPDIVKLLFTIIKNE